eukprot:1141776-Pelagomonas_calceolata.AAC.8
MPRHPMRSIANTETIIPAMFAFDCSQISAACRSLFRENPGGAGSGSSDALDARSFCFNATSSYQESLAYLIRVQAFSTYHPLQNLTTLIPLIYIKTCRNPNTLFPPRSQGLQFASPLTSCRIHRKQKECLRKGGNSVSFEVCKTGEGLIRHIWGRASCPWQTCHSNVSQLGVLACELGCAGKSG